MKTIATYLIPMGLIWCASTGAFAELPGVSYAGGDGSSFEKAIVLKAPDMKTGMLAEHSYIAKQYPGYQRGSQRMEQQEGKTFDIIEFTTNDGQKHTLLFRHHFVCGQTVTTLTG
jgi:hypothetical protein